MRVTLRFALRVLATITLTTIIIFSFSQSSSAYKALNERISAIRPGNGYPLPTLFNTTRPVTSVQDLWTTWAEAYRSTAPKNALKVELMFDAGNIPVPATDSSPRTQTSEHLQGLDSIPALEAAHAAFLARLHSWPQDLARDVFNGTGVVTVGGGEYFGPAIIGIHMLRRSGSTLPVQVFVANKAEYEVQVCEVYLPKLGAQCLIISDFVTEFEVTHYQLKSLAMLLSSFAEVLYLDSDSIPLVDPAKELFATEPFASTGLVIWPDFWIATESPSFYKVVGLGKMPPGLPRSSSEAGQLLIDKRRHLKTLLLANYYNIYGPKYYYPLLSQGALGQGDKETFMAAALVLDTPYYRVKTGVESVGRNDGIREKGSGMIQHLPADDYLHHNSDSSIRVRPAFVHANTPKMNAGHLVDEGDLLAADHHTPIRLWGPEEEQIMDFGLDLEKGVWELVVQTGCELANVVKEWKNRENLCERLNEHWDALFKDGGREPRS